MYFIYQKIKKSPPYVVPGQAEIQESE